MKLPFASLGLSLILALTATFPAEAFKLVPMSRVFSPVGSGATQSYQIVNDSDAPIAVEVSVVERMMALDGKESYLPADEDFLVYPPQIILPPNQSQVVRVSWLGDPQPIQELAYRLIAEQIPIELVQSDASPTQPTGAVQVSIRYAGSIFVRPNNVAADVVLDRIQPQVSETGAPELALTLSNQGTASTILRNLTLTLRSGGQQVILSGQDLKGISGERILAKNKRQFLMPWPAGLPQSEDVNVEFTFDP